MPFASVAASPLSTLVAAINSSVAMAGLYTTYLGSRALSLQTAPGRIVIFPVSGPVKTARSIGTTLRDVDLDLVAHIWGEGGGDDPYGVDHAWDMRQRLIQALEEQAAAGGLYYQTASERWDTSNDTEKQGQEIELQLTVILSAAERNTAGTGVGLVSQVQLTRQ